jgi:hypothetical protein
MTQEEAKACLARYNANANFADSLNKRLEAKP